MKSFDKCKIVCCVQVHNDDESIDILLEDIRRYTTHLYVNLNDATPHIVDAIQDCPIVRKVLFTENKDGKWIQGLQRDNTIRMLDDVKPDIVLFPDSDEVYPENLMEQLKKFWEDENKKTFWFRLLYMWNDEQHFRNDGKWKCIHHVRAFKWQPKITYLPYKGYACPTTFGKLPRDTKFHSDTPIKHYGYMTEEQRKRKWERDGKYTEEFVQELDKGKLIKKIC